MELHNLISVTETEEAGVYIAKVDITDSSSDRYECDYISREGDVFGLAPTIRAAVQNWIDDGGVVNPHTPTPPTTEEYRVAIQGMIDDKARSRLYDNGLALSTYVNSTNQQWAAEAQAFVAWRDSVWTYTYEQLALVQAGERDIPTVQEFLQELPQITWP